jgi:hypothetical protein
LNGIFNSGGLFGFVGNRLVFHGHGCRYGWFRDFCGYSNGLLPSLQEKSVGNHLKGQAAV